MSRKRTLTMGIFAMPAQIAEAAVGTLTPAQRELITPSKASEIMSVCVDSAARIARIVERQEHQAEVPIGAIKRSDKE